MRAIIAIFLCLSFLAAGAADTAYLRNDHAAPDPEIFPADLNHSSSVSLTTFKTTLYYDQVMIKWSTAAEGNCKFFTVERSVDGVHYDFVGFVVSRNEAFDDYRILDNSPINGINYYRLSTTDRNGKIAYIATGVINYMNNTKFSAALLDCSNGNMKMIINSGKQDALELNIFDTNNKRVFHDSFKVATGSTAKSFHLQKGPYTAVLINAGGEKVVN